MPEEIKERLSKTEYDKVGEMLLELIAECPYIPADLKGKTGGIQTGDLLYWAWFEFSISQWGRISASES